MFGEYSLRLGLEPIDAVCHGRVEVGSLLAGLSVNGRRAAGIAKTGLDGEGVVNKGEPRGLAASRCAVLDTRWQAERLTAR